MASFNLQVADVFKDTDPVTGFPFYDPAGRRGGEIRFATLASHRALHSTDFIVTHQFVELV